MPFDFSVTSFCFRWWQKTAQPLRSSFLLQGGDRQAFLATTWEMYPLRFQVQISRIQRQNKFSSSSFSDVGTGQKLLASEQIKYSAFSRTFLVLGNRTRDSSAQKNSMKYHKGKSKYLFIYLLFFLGMAFLFFFYNSKLGPHLLPLRVPHRHIRFAFFTNPQNMAHEIHFPTEFSSNPNQTHPSMLINFFRIFRKPQVGELDQGWS